MTYLDRAIKDGYAIITGPENKQKIIYVTSDNHTENYNDPEEKVRAEFWAELIYEYDYPAHRIKVEVTIPDRVPTDRADIVIFSDDECKKPYAVVECKRDGVTDAEFLQAIEQGVGNATWVKLRASYVVIIAGATRRVLDFSDDSTGILERENNIIADLPKAYDFLTIVPGQLKTICDTTHPILPIWEREKRNHCFAVRPIYMSNNDYIYSPIIMEEVRKRWIEGFLQFYPPFEIGLERTCTALYAWKNNYEHLFSSEVEVLLKESGCEYAKHDVDLRREDRRGNHPTIDVLGDYDVIGLNTTQKRIFIIECKVLQPIGSVFEHSNQQKRFFTKEKFDEKFQKRIDYFSKVAMSFFANHGYDTEGFTINPYMVVNKVFSSYYKHVQFPIVTFDELKREIQL